MANEKIDFTATAWWENSSFGSFSTNGSFFVGKHDIGGGMSTSKGALRFTGIDVGQGETIGLADLHIWMNDGHGQLKIKAWGVKETNPDANYPFARTKTTAFNTIDSAYPGDGNYVQIGVVTMLQEIVNQGGWSRNNAVEFIMEENGIADGDYMHAGDGSNSYLAYRVGSEPNFKPTPFTVNAPKVPAPLGIGLKISRSLKNVLQATEQDLFFNSNKSQIKVFKEGFFTSSSSGNAAIVHGLGYMPMVNVYNKVLGKWYKLGGSGFNFTDAQTYYLDTYNLYLHSSTSGQDFFYRIFLDQLPT